MSRHWRPSGKIVRIRSVRQGPWTRADAYWDRHSRRRRVRLGHGTVQTLLFGAVLAGLIGGTAWERRTVPAAKVDTSAIQWNAVQAVPTRAPDAADIEWERRAKEQGSPSTGSGPAVQVVRGSAEAGAGARSDVFVIDGDTFVMGGQRIRIAGIDTPETHEPRCAQELQRGRAATEKLRQLLGSGAVAVSGTKIDKYGREVRDVQVGGRDVAEIMIGESLARSYEGGTRQPWC